MIPEMTRSVIIVAGGKGLRVGGELPKQFQCIGGVPMLMRTIRAFHDYDYRMRIIVVLPEGMQPMWLELCDEYQFSIPLTIVAGGETRFHSVKNGLETIGDDEIVGIHDAARPFVTSQLLKRCFETASISRCGVIPVVDEVNSVRLVYGADSKNIDRKQVKIVQTPQVFPAGEIKRAYETAFESSFTDDASVAEKQGVKIQLVEGEEANRKITTSFDMAFADYYCRIMTDR